MSGFTAHKLLTRPIEPESAVPHMAREGMTLTVLLSGCALQIVLTAVTSLSNSTCGEVESEGMG